MVNPDFIMRQIELMTDAIGKLLFHKDVSRVELFEQDLRLSGEGLLSQRLFALVKKGEINQAENLLFEQLDSEPNPRYLAVGVNFYKDLMQLSDAQLSAANFSRQEIQDGLFEIQRRM